jgi:hypothetical protein
VLNVLNFLQQLSGIDTEQRPARVVPATPAAPIFNFNFVEETETEAAPQPQPVIMRAYRETYSGSLGKTGQCVTHLTLVDSDNIENAASHKEGYVQQEVSESVINLRAHKARVAYDTKVKASALTGVAELSAPQTKVRSNTYSKPIAPAEAGKKVSMKVLQKLSERSTRSELLEKVEVAQRKVSAEALSAPSRNRQGKAQERYSIRIKIG